MINSATQTFLDDSNYLGRSRIKDDEGDDTGYVKFNPPNSFYYYAVYNDDDSLYLKSPSFETEKARDNSFNELLAKIGSEEAFEVHKEAEAYYSFLIGKSGSILGKSAPFKTFIDAFKTTPKGQPFDITDGIF